MHGNELRKNGQPTGLNILERAVTTAAAGPGRGAAVALLARAAASADDPLVPLARDVARSLVEAGFTLHHGACADSAEYACSRSPAPAIPAATEGSWCPGQPMTCCAWTGDRQVEYQGAHEVMNGARPIARRTASNRLPLGPQDSSRDQANLQVSPVVV